MAKKFNELGSQYPQSREIACWSQSAHWNGENEKEWSRHSIPICIGSLGDIVFTEIWSARKDFCLRILDKTAHFVRLKK